MFLEYGAELMLNECRYKAMHISRDC